MDYAHRTTAEFLGAEWLAERIRAGLPLGRVQALIGVEGHPAQELRGLHAWLARFLPGDADQLIEADPYGVLTYGDAGSLSPTSRRQRATRGSSLLGWNFQYLSKQIVIEPTQHGRRIGCNAPNLGPAWDP